MCCTRPHKSFVVVLGVSLGYNTPNKVQARDMCGAHISSAASNIIFVFFFPVGKHKLAGALVSFVRLWQESTASSCWILMGILTVLHVKPAMVEEDTRNTEPSVCPVSGRRPADLLSPLTYTHTHTRTHTHTQTHNSLVCSVLSPTSIFSD